MAQILHTILSPFAYVVFLALKEFKEKALEEFRSLLTFSPPIIYRPVLNKFGWWMDPKNLVEFNIPKLRLFHYLLVQYGFITCSFEEFEIHFIHDKILPEREIEWKGEVMVLVLLFHTLIFEKKIIPPPNNLSDSLYDHFVLFDEKKVTRKKLSKGSLKSTLTNVSHPKRNLPMKDIVKNICDLLLS